MKAMSNDDDCCNTNSSSNNINNGSWLGFSLSPHHLNMESSSDPHHSQTQPNPHHRHQCNAAANSTTAATAPASPASALPITTASGFFSVPSAVVDPAGSHHYNYNNNAIYYGVVENGSFYSPHQFPVMPLKSDGTLCVQGIVPAAAATSTSNTTTTTTSPKLEDFFGGETMGSHHYHQNNDTVSSMALSLDSIYYQQQQHQNQLQQDNSRTQQQQDIPTTISQVQQHYSCYSGCNNNIHEQQLLSMTENEMRNWAAQRSYISSSSQALDHHHQKMMSGGGGGCVSMDTANGNGGGGEYGGHNSNANMSSTAICSYGDLQSLTLSMSPGSQSSSCNTGSQSQQPQHQQQQISAAPSEQCMGIESRKRSVYEKADHQKPIVHRKSIDTFGQRTSQYRGVTRHRWTGRYEAHLWDNSCKREGQTRKGRQVYLGGYDTEEKAARAYDMAALKYWGPSTHINFSLENYQQEIEDMKNMTRQEFVAHLRRKSSGFSRGASMYRGVTRHHQHGRWQARIGRVAGNKDLYLGTFSTQEEAAEAYDIAAIKFRGVNAVTNFDISRYDVERIIGSNTLLAGDLARRNKTATRGASNNNIDLGSSSDHLNHHLNNCNAEAVIPVRNTTTKNNDTVESDGWKMVLHHQAAAASAQQQLDHHQQQNTILGVGNMTANFDHRNNVAMRMVDHPSVPGCGTPVQQHQEAEDLFLGKMGGGTHLSNSSSLVTSLGSSREGSPAAADKSSSNLQQQQLPLPFTMPPPASKVFPNPSSNVNVNPWTFPSVPLRPPPISSLPHLPVFAAWADS